MRFVSKLALMIGLLLWVGAPALAQEAGEAAPATETEPPATETQPAEEAPTETPADVPAETNSEQSASDRLEETTNTLDDVFGDDDFSDEGEDDAWGDELEEPQFPRLEHRGYFRFRADMFSGLDLGTHYRTTSGATQGTSAFRPPLTENGINNTDADPEQGAENDESVIGGANLRFRWQPTFLISPSFKFTATFDVMDNLVMGSTPDFNFSRPDAPLSAFSTTQAPPGEGFQFQDSIRVKEVWGEWKLLGMPLRFGRMKSDWGLGILANGGDDWDDDFGDYNDRVMLVTQLYGMYFFGGYDIVSSGPTYKQADNPFGQAYDLTDTDDVQQGFFGVFSKPLQEEELTARRNHLVRDRKVAFDWGLYTVFRSQNLDQNSTSAAPGTPYDEIELINRSAWAVIPDLWLRLEYRPSYTQRLRLELEATMVYGEIENVLNEFDKSDNAKRELLSWAVAFEGDYTTGGLTLGLDAGAASGDSANCLAVQDCKNFANSDPVTGGTTNDKITNFRFDRNYHVDQILFREVIGTVTNAWYAKPYIRYDLYESPDGALGGRLDVLVAGALEEDAYPGSGSFLGTEIDATIFVEDANKFYADLSFGLFLPGGAFDLLPGYQGYPTDSPKVEASLAWTLQTHLVLKY